MKVKALVSFSGDFSMYKGEVKECSDNTILQDLLNCEYIEKASKSKEKVKANED
ncbi:hypothetical protein [Clostridium tetani]|uniref:hypothetical protein n=1 Tax=Clostridium tetani TaxID=1513 RepID=UPI0013E94FDD|nr:hypothetical protein [Clostridium tetani]